jgi:hypothetical protein
MDFGVSLSPRDLCTGQPRASAPIRFGEVPDGAKTVSGMNRSSGRAVPGG